jgi:hypothetical protein
VGRNTDGKLNAGRGKDMMTPSVIANLNTIFPGNGNKVFNPPVMWVLPHIFQQLIGCGHEIMILNIIL